MSRRLIQHDIHQVGLELLHPLQIILSELELLLRVVVELDRALVGSKVFAVTERISNASLTLLFPASSITFDGRSIWIRLADNFDPLLAACAVNAQLRFTGRSWARPVRMARSHTFVTALRSYLHALFATAILHKLFHRVEAFARFVTNLNALVTTGQIYTANLAAVWCRLVAENISEELFTTVA